MDTFKIFVICLIGIVLFTTTTAYVNEVYGSNKSEKFIQQNNFTITKLKDNLTNFGGWSSDGFVGNGTLSVILKFENGSKVSYNDVKTLGVEFGRGFISSNGFIQNNDDTMTPGGFGNGFSTE